MGPNCLGIAKTDPAVRLNATFAPTELRRGSVGLMTHSGGVGIAALQRASELSIGLSGFVSAGNKADVSGNDMLMYCVRSSRGRSRRPGHTAPASGSSTMSGCAATPIHVASTSTSARMRARRSSISLPSPSTRCSAADALPNDLVVVEQEHLHPFGRHV
ncbi:MAG: hypothetical protein J2P24_10890 [Streptosporangiales bacterium]|nr:hypothetical protein [Streptosporangiales bacterium]MBO0892395.1 hypothetical protein [Acidothermales bacterium]